MSDCIKCDGCGHELRSAQHPHQPGDREHALTGKRVNAHAVGSTVLPKGKFDLCSGCAVIGFEAIAQAYEKHQAELRDRLEHATQYAQPLPERIRQAREEASGAGAQD